MDVFTPRGDAVPLPDGATPVDFAYALSDRIGRRYIGARVNGRLESMGHPLEDGDMVEIFTSKPAPWCCRLRTAVTRLWRRS